MRFRDALIVPAVGDIWVLSDFESQAGAGHSQAVEVGLGEVAEIQAEALRLAAVFDDELQQDEAFAGVAEARSRVEMDFQLLIWLDEPEIAESCGMGEAHARGDFFPARVVGQIFVGAVFVWKDGIGP